MLASRPEQDAAVVPRQFVWVSLSLVWVHLPGKCGNWRGINNRLRMWAVDGTWERVSTALMAQADADEYLPCAVSVDSTIVRAHQHATGARK